MVEYKLENRWVLFGSGEIVHFEDTRERIVNGNKIVDFLFTPNDFIVERYALKEGEEISRDHGLITRSYPREYVKFLPECGGTQMVIVKTNFFGEATELSQEMMEKDETIRYHQREIRMLSGANMRLLEQSSAMTKRYQKFFKEQKELYDLAQFKQPKQEQEEQEL